MASFTRLEIITEDRIGMALDILKLIYKANINIVSLEVFPKRVCVKMEDIDDGKKKILVNDLYSLKGVYLINEIQLLAYETNQRKLLAVIDSVDEGIIAVNKNLEIEIFNSYCEKIFNYNKEEVLGTDIRKLVGNAPIVNLLRNSEKYDNVEINIKNKRGEIHYLTTGRPVKDDDNQTLGAVASIRDIKKAIEIANIVSATEVGAFNEIIGNSPLIERVKKISSTVAKSNSTVLLRGKSGTGKELFARAIHNLSTRKNKKFVTINCAALPDNLIESELFGYEKGSFTGAIDSGKEGLFKEAHGGTLFLDEISELSMALQAKLLRVLQEGIFRKIGSTKEESVDVRVIAATNKNLEEMIKNHKFREDLYYRLNVIPIFIPPLRERLEDIPLLVRFFIDKLNKKLNKKISGAELEFINKLLNYDWPGNVRELKNVVERAMNLCEKNILTVENLVIDFYEDAKIIKNNFNFERDVKLREIVEICEKEAIIKALNKNKSFRKTAKALGVSHTTIINKIKKYDIKM